MNFVSADIFFNDTIESLRHEFKDDTSDTVVICGAHELSRRQGIDLYRERYKKVVVFNQEPLTATQRTFMHNGYREWIKSANEVWDYDEQNIEILKSIRPDVKLHVLKPYKIWPQSHVKDIDILFYGAINEHRGTLLKHLSEKYKIVVCNGKFGSDLDSYILRSKILLNIHYYYECAMQEQARIVRWLGAPSRIVSEKSKTNYLGIEEMGYEELFNL